MGIIEDKANAIATEMGKGQNNFIIDIALIGAIISIISDIISIYQACEKTPQSTAASMRSGGILEKRRLKKVINKYIDADDIRLNVLAGTLLVGSTIQDDEVEKMFIEIGEKK